MNNKQALINQLLANNIEKKTIQINYFPDRTFFQDVRSNRLSGIKKSLNSELN